MNLRKNRVHLTGNSNFDYKSKDKLSESSNNFRPEVTSIDYLSIPKPKNFDQLMRERILRTAPDPLGKTQTFYEEIGKKPIVRTKIWNFRSSQLEEKEKMKRVFTGDSDLGYNDLMFGNYENVKFKEEKRGSLFRNLFFNLNKC